MKSKKFLKVKVLILIFVLIFNITSIKSINAITTSNSKEVEKELQKIISIYGEENIVFVDGIYLYTKEEINLNYNENYKGVVWKSENEDIATISNNVIKGKSEGTTFIIGSKDNKYYIREVYVAIKSSESSISQDNSASNSINSVEDKVSESNYIVYIDPGHGGTDPGAQGNGIVEKKLVLDLSLRLKKKLEKMGITVVMSRTTDKYVSLEDRVSGANKVKPDAFISVHANSATATSASGIETFYYKNIDKSLADKIQNNLISYTGATNRGVKKDSYYVVKNTNIPAALVECGFMSNASEAKKLKNNSYQEKLINSMLDGVLQYIYSSDKVTAKRIYGSDRYETSYKLFKEGWTSSKYVVLASGADYPDALCATPLASKYDAPILLVKNMSLTRQKQLVNLLKEKGVSNVLIVGGTGVISSTVEKELKDLGLSVERFGGADRYETSINIAKKVGIKNGEIAVATGQNFADGLSISSVAAIREMPIILVKTNYLPNVVNSYLKNIKISKTYVIGLEGAVSNSVSTKFKNVERIGGSDRYETNKNIHNKFKNDIDNSNIYIASGADFPDALSVSALAGKKSGFLVISETNSVKESVRELMVAIRPNIKNLYVVGGNAVVRDRVIYNLGATYIK